MCSTAAWLFTAVATFNQKACREFKPLWYFLPICTLICINVCNHFVCTVGYVARYRPRVNYCMKSIALVAGSSVDRVA